MRFFRMCHLVLILGVSLLSGCATQKNVQLSEKFWQDKPKVVVAHYKAPEPGMTVSGHQGLLDMAITRMTNNKIIDCLKRSDLSWYPKISDQFAQQLKQRSIGSVVDPTPIANDKALLAKAGGDKLLALKLQAVGIRREYSMGIISGGAPQAYCVLIGELIDPSNPKKPLWRSEIEVMQPVQGKWDQPPHFPNVMAALNEATTAARTELLDSFFSGH